MLAETNSAMMRLPRLPEAILKVRSWRRVNGPGKSRSISAGVNSMARLEATVARRRAVISARTSGAAWRTSTGSAAGERWETALMMMEAIQLTRK